MGFAIAVTNTTTRRPLSLGISSTPPMFLCRLDSRFGARVTSDPQAQGRLAYRVRREVKLGGATWQERAAISFFGIRGVGSLYCLSYASNEEEFPGKETLWALVAFVIVLSIIVHGISGAPVMGVLDRRRARANV